MNNVSIDLDLEYLKNIGKRKFQLESEYVNDNTLIVYSKKYTFDSWLITKESEDMFCLWHLNKKSNNTSKCMYHLQCRAKRKNKQKVMYEIYKHNKRKVLGRKNKPTNLVDKVLKNVS